MGKVSIISNGHGNKFTDSKKREKTRHMLSDKLYRTKSTFTGAINTLLLKRVRPPRPGRPEKDNSVELGFKVIQEYCSCCVASLDFQGNHYLWELWHNDSTEDEM